MGVMMLKMFFNRFLYFTLASLSRILATWRQAEVLKQYPSIVDYQFCLPKNVDHLHPHFSKWFLARNNFPSYRILLFKNVNVIGTGVVFKYFISQFGL